MTDPSPYRMTLAHVRAELAASMGGYDQRAATTVTYDSENDQTTINSSGLINSPKDPSGLAGKYQDGHFAGAWVHFRPNADSNYDFSSWYVVESKANGDLVVPGQVGVAKEGDFFDLFTTFSVDELNRALRFGLEEMRLYYHGQFDPDNEKEEISSNGLFSSSQIKGVWFRNLTGELGATEDAWINLNNWETFDNEGRVFVSVPFEYTPARDFFEGKEFRVEYVARYTVGSALAAAPADQFFMEDEAIVGGDLNRQLARSRERLFYMRTLSCGAADREYWGMMLQDARIAQKEFELPSPRIRARKALTTRWGKYAGSSI